MSYHAHDMCLPSFFVDCVAHGLAVDGEALILPAVVGIPAGKCAVERNGIDADENVANSAFAGDNPNPLVDPAAEAFTCLGAQILAQPPIAL